MPSNLAIDDALLAKARRVGKHKTKRETVERALREYVERHEQRAILNLAGKLDWDPKYDYKAARRRSR